MYAWHVVRGADGRVEAIDAWQSLDAVIAEMVAISWDQPDCDWASYVTDDDTGAVAAVALFGPDRELLISVADGRQLRFPAPDIYRKQCITCDDGTGVKGARP